ncbi:hypothetical protein ACIBEJ_34555 [Nonomuraea sp. NPDC050790]|uniref:hypothetical protein n=1 Tax=Nonomuraea sp. NPDC050790 TaxID=3364371 RepID=UPI0037980427
MERPTGIPAGATMTVRVRDSLAEHWQDATFKPQVVTITVPAICTVCGGPRGEVREHQAAVNDHPYIVDVWDNACGHVDMYEDVIQEARAIVLQAGGGA